MSNVGGPADEDTAFSQQVGRQARRKLAAAGGSRPSVWLGLAASGVIGWSVVIPTLLGAAFGRWADQRLPTAFSWTLALASAGLVLGCVNAWRWITKENAPDPGDEEGSHV